MKINEAVKSELQKTLRPIVKQLVREFINEYFAEKYLKESVAKKKVVVKKKARIDEDDMSFGSMIFGKSKQRSQNTQHQQIKKKPQVVRQKITGDPKIDQIIMESAGGDPGILGGEYGFSGGTEYAGAQQMNVKNESNMDFSAFLENEPEPNLGLNTKVKTPIQNVERMK